MGKGLFIMATDEIIKDLKRHLNVDYDEDDTYIGDLYDVACSSVSLYLQAPLDDYRDSDGKLVASIRHAIRLLVGNWYANREGVAFASATELPYGVAQLLTPLKRFDIHSYPVEEEEVE